MTHNLCPECTTAAHCYRNGCIPLAEESALTAARSSGGCTELQDEPMTTPEQALSALSWILLVVILGGVGAAVFWIWAMFHDLITAIKAAIAAWKRQRWIRNRRASIQTPFD